MFFQCFEVRKALTKKNTKMCFSPVADQISGQGFDLGCVGAENP